MKSKNVHNQETGSSVERSNKRIEDNGEVFTPDFLCHQMIDCIPDHDLKNPNSTFLDNSAGSGNFIVALQNRLLKYHSLQHINDNMLYAVELMPDNHAEMCKRVGVSTTHPHFVCADAVTYNYSFGEPTGVESFFT